MKYSIKKQMAILIISVILFTFLLWYGLSNVFLVRYYTLQKQNKVMEIYHLLDQTFQADVESQAIYSMRFQEECRKYNIDYLIQWPTPAGIKPVGNVNEEAHLKLLMELNNYKFQQNIGAKRIIKETENYVLQRVENKNHLSDEGQPDSIELIGILDNGYWFIFQTPIESIQAYASITNQFLGIIAIIGLLISTAIVWGVAKKATSPILELVDISKRMTALDFDAKYTSGGMNEIGLLGQHFNQMSYKLERTISQLKSANIELQKDIEKKIEIDEMRKEFLSNISHELKTPISLIQGYAEGLKESINEDEESKDFYCEVIIDEANKMNHMVKKLLTLNQIESGNDTIVLERFDIIKLIDGILVSSNILIKQKEAKIIFDNAQSIFVWGDEFRVEEVITNYLTNALNHLMNEKIIEIKVLKKEEKARITVFNTGKPIPEEEIEKIWIKFYKIDKARTRTYGGNGIGLSIVKAIMDSLKQKYGIVNYNNGVEFWIELEATEKLGENEL